MNKGLDTSKVLLVSLKLYIGAGSAKATPPLGPLLGQFGVNTVQFCKEFNEATEGFSLFFDNLTLNSVIESQGFQLIVYIYIYDDRKYTFMVDKPTVSFLLRVLANVEKGNPIRKVGYVNFSDFIKIALFKFPDARLYSACKMLKGTARSIGVFISK